jgi:hypothetical protein
MWSYVYIIAKQRLRSVLQATLVRSAVQQPRGHGSLRQLVPEWWVVQAPAPAATVRDTPLRIQSFQLTHKTNTNIDLRLFSLDKHNLE